MLTETEQRVLKQLDKPTGDGEERLQKYRAEQQEIKNEKTKNNPIVMGSVGFMGIRNFDFICKYLIF